MTFRLAGVAWILAAEFAPRTRLYSLAWKALTLRMIGQ